MVAPGIIQISGFCDNDNYMDVVKKGANGLNIAADLSSLSLIVSNGLVTNTPLQSDNDWTLGEYTLEIGGVQSQSKKTFGIYHKETVPSDVRQILFFSYKHNMFAVQ